MEFIAAALNYLLGIPLFVYGNVVGSTAWIVGSTCFIVAVSTGFCVALPKRAG